jgi:hypothetical protein
MRPFHPVLLAPQSDLGNSTRKRPRQTRNISRQATCISPPSADDHDAGGNKKLISSEGGPHPSNLHHYWDRVCGTAGDRPPPSCGEPDRTDLRAATSGVVEGHGGGLGHGSFRAHSPRRLRTSTSLRNHGTYTLPAAYAEQAEKDVALQLSRAGVRLAFALDRAFTGSQ